MLSSLGFSRALWQNFGEERVDFLLKVQKTSIQMLDKLRNDKNKLCRLAYFSQPSPGEHPGCLLTLDVASIVNDKIDNSPREIYSTINRRPPIDEHISALILTLVTPWLHAFGELMVQSVLAIGPDMRTGPIHTQHDILLRMNCRLASWTALSWIVDTTLAEVVVGVVAEAQLQSGDEADAFRGFARVTAEYVKQAMQEIAELVGPWMKAYLLGDDRPYSPAEKC